MSETVRVVKLGGSLLELPGLANVLRRWLATQSFAKSVFVVGGGPWTDAVGQADTMQGLGEEASHWLCIRALSVTARLLAAILPEAKAINYLDELRDWLLEGPKASLAIFELESFLRVEEPGLPPAPLPHTWEVTTDSLAARLAQALDAELIVLKSNDAPADHDLSLWASEGYVDPWFPRIASRLPSVNAVNLRHFAENLGKLPSRR